MGIWPPRAVIWTTLACAALAGLPACEREDGPAAKPSAEVSAAPSASAAAVDFGPTGVKACDDYFAAVKGCREQLDAPTRARLEQDVTQYRKQIEGSTSEAAKTAVGIGCDAAREALADDGCTL